MYDCTAVSCYLWFCVGNSGSLLPEWGWGTPPPPTHQGLLHQGLGCIGLALVRLWFEMVSDSCLHLPALTSTKRRCDPCWLPSGCLNRSSDGVSLHGEFGLECTEHCDARQCTMDAPGCHHRAKPRLVISGGQSALRGRITVFLVDILDR